MSCVLLLLSVIENIAVGRRFRTIRLQFIILYSTYYVYTVTTRPVVAVV